ncbi:MAG TPA: sigma-70 family RNA polymerase sigma factor [Anaerolineae bacterium]|nr:sigma-70 family RNA polymerase sigma factor [Anaerolineae bacterium]
MRTLADIAQQCARETDRFFQGQSYDPQHCFELFQRAILEREQSAWELIHAQYQSLVAGWVRQHSGLEASGEEVQYFVNRAFEKIWVALTPDKFSRFSELKSLLGYLKMCVHSAIIDHGRSTDRVSRYATVDEPDIDSKTQHPTVEDQTLDRMYRQSLWEWILARLHDEKERLVIQSTYVQALKPRQIYDQFQVLFDEVDEVYRIKQNVLARLRRDPEFRKLLGEYE